MELLPANFTSGKCYVVKVAVMHQVKWETTFPGLHLYADPAAKPGGQPTSAEIKMRMTQKVSSSTSKPIYTCL